MRPWLPYPLAALSACLLGWLVAAPAMALEDPRVPLLAGAVVATAGVTMGVHRSRTVLGRVDPFHPLIFPLAYIAVSFLAPAWMMLVEREPLLGFTLADLHQSTGALMALAVAGFAFGLSWRFHRRQVERDRSVDYTVVLFAGRALLLVPLSLAVSDFATGGVTARGLNQMQYGVSDALDALARIAAPVAVLLITAAYRGLGCKRLMAKGDWTVVVGLVGLVGLNGSRSAAVSILLCLLYAHTRHRAGRKGLLVGLVAGVAFVLTVASYRATQLTGAYEKSATEASLTDWSVATYTTGVTAGSVPLAHDYTWGLTYLDALIRQLPSPIVNYLYGGPTETGTLAFRQFAGVTNPHQGYGYSVPAEAYLNFGAVGVFGVCFLLGLLLAWAYTRHEWPTGAVLGLVYPLLVIPLPASIRSDAVGLIKGSLYPVLMAGGVILLARSIAAYRGGRDDDPPFTLRHSHRPASSRRGPSRL